jgi:hypothetical protein
MEICPCAKKKETKSQHILVWIDPHLADLTANGHGLGWSASQAPSNHLRKVHIRNWASSARSAEAGIGVAAERPRRLVSPPNSDA